MPEWILGDIRWTHSHHATDGKTEGKTKVRNCCYSHTGIVTVCNNILLLILGAGTCPWWSDVFQAKASCSSDQFCINWYNWDDRRSYSPLVIHVSLLVLPCPCQKYTECTQKGHGIKANWNVHSTHHIGDSVFCDVKVMASFIGYKTHFWQ